MGFGVWVGRWGGCGGVGGRVGVGGCVGCIICRVGGTGVGLVGRCWGAAVGLEGRQLFDALPVPEKSIKNRRFTKGLFLIIFALKLFENFVLFLHQTSKTKLLVIWLGLLINSFQKFSHNSYQSTSKNQ